MIVQRPSGIAASLLSLALTLSASISSASARKEAAYADAPSRGPQNAAVTLVEWVDFRSVACKRAAPVIEKLLRRYPSDLRVVVLNNPASTDKASETAAAAAIAAARQGQFWLMLDLLFDHQTATTGETYEKWAGQLGLDAHRFAADVVSTEVHDRVRRESQMASQAGVTASPGFLVNDVSIPPTASLDDVVRAVEIAVQEANARLAGQAPAPTPKPSEQAIDAVASPPDKTSPVRGPDSAPVTIMEFSDFQCPFCAQIEPTLAKLREKYRVKIKIVWKNNPLEFHQFARPAAKAALAARAQGKFWEMHDMIFAHQNELRADPFVRWAGELHLDVKRFKRDLKNPGYDAILDADIALATTMGASGTPTCFINGEMISGNDELEEFVTVIDRALQVGQ